jgi:histidine triad (HIT) family protein
MSDCIFCRIATGELGTPFLHADADCVAFRDLHPQAPTHVLVIPRRHLASLAAAAPEDGQLLGHLLAVAADLARQLGVAAAGYRVVSNCGPDGGQSVSHLHLHLLAGRAMGWPPG